MHWYSVYQTIYNIVHSVNEMFRWILELLTNNAIFEVFNKSVAGNAIVGIIESAALTLCVLFFLVEFFQKSLHLQWATWENILLFFMKLILAKAIISNTGAILTTIQKGFASMIPEETISGNLLPESVANGTESLKKMREEAEDAVEQDFENGLYDDEIQAIWDKYSPNAWKAATAILDFFETKVQEKLSGGSAGGDMVGFFVPPDSDEYLKICSLKKRSSWFDFEPLLCNLKIMIQGLIMQVVVLIACIIVLARIFELVVYTALAPIPLATLSCDGLQDVGKNFLKSFAAVCVQAIIIIVMFIVFKTFISSSNPIELPDAVKSWGALLYTFIFGAGIMQSGNWAKKICGAM